MLRKVLWWLVVAGLLSSLPLVYARHETETSANQVEFVFDYRDLVDMSDLQADPQGFIANQLKALKAAGVQSLAVYEATLNELKTSRRIDVYNSRDAAMFAQKLPQPGENYTYVLFADTETQKQLQPLIEKTFADLKVETATWSLKDRPGLQIRMSPDEAAIKPMDPDPITLNQLHDQGFHIIARLTNRRPYSSTTMDQLLSKLHAVGVERIVADGDAMPGFTDETPEVNLKKMAKLLNKYGIGLATIELSKEPQKGLSTLAKETNYNIVRLHSFTEKDGEKLTEPVSKEELESRVQGVADRFVLAVKDRNIRIIFLNGKLARSVDKGTLVDPIRPLLDSLNGKDGAIPRIEKVGFTTGQAQAFAFDDSGWQKVARVFVLLGGVALIVLTVAAFFPGTALALFVIGLVGAIGLHALSANLYAQGLALATAICAPSLAVMLAVRTVRTGRAAAAKSRIGFSLWLLIRTSAISAIGIVYVVGLLNHISYMLVLQQFRGVSLLHLAPIAIVALYLLLFSENLTHREKLERIRRLLSAHIRVFWLVVAAVAAGALFYYLTRTGNEGQASTFEKLFRSFLENTLGVRPRTKEFLLAHPLFLLAGYLCVRYRNAVYLLIVGVIGQLSLVDTFAHLHTPLHISAIRISYGLIFGILIGLVLIAVWEILVRSWKKWTPRFDA
ncbi:hypothetical protein B5M42_018855 [Paenibacillus athensensis]|nr:hypothetical protein [Paenibacillus athensensis]